MYRAYIRTCTIKRVVMCGPTSLNRINCRTLHPRWEVLLKLVGKGAARGRVVSTLPKMSRGVVHPLLNRLFGKAAISVETSTRSLVAVVVHGLGALRRVLHSLKNQLRLRTIGGGVLTCWEKKE